MPHALTRKTFVQRAALALGGTLLASAVQAQAPVEVQFYYPVAVGGAILGAMLIGMTRAVGQQFAADWIFLLTYALLIVTLIFRPEGLFNVRERQA